MFCDLLMAQSYWVIFQQAVCKALGLDACCATSRKPMNCMLIVQHLGSPAEPAGHIVVMRITLKLRQEREV